MSVSVKKFLASPPLFFLALIVVFENISETCGLFEILVASLLVTKKQSLWSACSVRMRVIRVDGGRGPENKRICWNSLMQGMGCQPEFPQQKKKTVAWPGAGSGVCAFSQNCPKKAAKALISKTLFENASNTILCLLDFVAHVGGVFGKNVRAKCG